MVGKNKQTQEQKNPQCPKSDNNKTSSIILLFLGSSTFSKFKYFGVLLFGILPFLLNCFCPERLVSRKSLGL